LKDMVWKYFQESEPTHLFITTDQPMIYELCSLILLDFYINHQNYYLTALLSKIF